MSLEHIFDEIEVTADPFALCELQGRCTLGLTGESGATLHYILAGSGEIVFQKRPPVRVERGTLALVPTLQAHTLRSFGGAGDELPACHPAELNLASHLIREEGDTREGALLAICSHLNVGIRGTNGLINLVREPIIETVSADAVMLETIDRLLRELSMPTLGSRALVRSILLQCTIHLLRNRLLAGDRGLSWMAALVDEKLWTSLRQMLDAPGDLHSVESLAETAGLSRSSFASRFSAAYGHGPMELLRELRMHEAASMLKRTDLPVKRIAQLVGFQSRSAFSRIFTRTTGASPQNFRSDQNRE